MPGFPVFQYLSEFAKTHIHWVGDAIKPSHPNKGRHNINMEALIKMYLYKYTN